MPAGPFANRGDSPTESSPASGRAAAGEARPTWLEGMASDYGNLGLIYQTRGDLDEARKLWGKAKELYQRIGMPHMVEEMARWINGRMKDERSRMKDEQSRMKDEAGGKPRRAGRARRPIR